MVGESRKKGGEGGIGIRGGGDRSSAHEGYSDRGHSSNNGLGEGGVEGCDDEGSISNGNKVEKEEEPNHNIYLCPVNINGYFLRDNYIKTLTVSYMIEKF